MFQPPCPSRSAPWTLTHPIPALRHLAEEGNLLNQKGQTKARVTPSGGRGQLGWETSALWWGRALVILYTDPGPAQAGPSSLKGF